MQLTALQCSQPLEPSSTSVLDALTLPETRVNPSCALAELFCGKEAVDHNI